MKQFYKKVDLRSRKAMTKFLEGHFRYDTANGCNRSTSYANNLKINNLGFTNEQEEKLLDMLDCAEAYDNINDKIWKFGYDHDWRWQAVFNGRSGGYLVLYRGGWKPGEYKSFCTSCGQKNYTTVEETGHKCGRCGKETRVNYKNPPKQIYSYPEKSVDMDEDFEEWSMNDLKQRVKLVQEFDRLCDKIVAEAA